MKELRSRQICFFFIAFLPVTKLFMMSSMVAKISNEDMWISLLINVLIDFLTLLTLILFFNNNDKPFMDRLYEMLGKKPADALLILYAVYFILKAVIPFNEQEGYVIQTLYLTMPNYFVFLPVFIVPVYLSLKKLRALGRCADVVWIFTLIGLALIFALSIGNIRLDNLLPIGANKAGVIAKGAFQAVSWFGDCVYFMFLIGNYEKEKHSTRNVLLSYGASLISVLLFGVVFWCTFSSIAFRQRFALTEISKYMTVINNIGRFDYLAIFFILFSSVFALSLPVYFSSLIVRRVFNIDNKWIVPLCITLFIAIFSVILDRFIVTTENFILHKCGIFFLIFNNIIPVILTIISRLSERRSYETQKN